MEISNELLTERAKALGFDDIRFADAGGNIATTSKDTLDLNSLLPGAASIIVLFVRYLPASQPPAGYMALSPYYIASNKAYNGAKQLTAYIEESGGKALHTVSISARAAALRTGGFIGDNGFYYHETFGSYVCIQTILTDAAQPEAYISDRTECLHCGACRGGCSGVGNLNDCLRQHMHGVVPEHLRGGVYQLLGCEKCQNICPLNPAERSVPHEFSLSDLLEGKGVERLKELAGQNMARTRRIISQAALYAANAGAAETAGKLKELSQAADEPVRSHALWAYKKLTGDNDDNA